MPELRKDPITREWVVVTSEDLERTLESAAAPSPAPGPCPFCPGREAEAGPELLAYRPCSTEPDTPGWRVRVVAARSPIRAGGELRRSDYLLYDTMQAVSAHEIVIETPEHHVSLADLDAAQVEDVLWACRERAEVLGRPDWVRYVSIFRNHGLEAAAPGHPHSQIVSAPVVPQGAWDRVRGLREYYDYRGQCALCQIIEQEVQARERVVFENRACVAVTPYASRRPFEVWLLPKRHAPGMSEVGPVEMRHLAAGLKDALLRLKAGLDDPPYHYHVLTAPCHLEHTEHVHWSIAITPRLAVPGALELGCGLFVNSVRPEEAARVLRTAVAPSLEAAAGRR